MASRTAYRHEGSPALTYNASSIERTEEQRADGPNINLEALSNERPISRAEIAILSAPHRTDLLARAMRKSKLPQDVFDNLTQKPAYNVDHSGVIAAALIPHEPLDIPHMDLQSFISVHAQTGASTAVGAEQDQQDCCNCCNLQ